MTWLFTAAMRSLPYSTAEPLAPGRRQRSGNSGFCLQHSSRFAEAHDLGESLSGFQVSDLEALVVAQFARVPVDHLVEAASAGRGSDLVSDQQIRYQLHSAMKLRTPSASIFLPAPLFTTSPRWSTT